MMFCRRYALRCKGGGGGGGAGMNFVIPEWATLIACLSTQPHEAQASATTAAAGRQVGRQSAAAGVPGAPGWGRWTPAGWPPPAASGSCGRCPPSPACRGSHDPDHVASECAQVSHAPCCLPGTARLCQLAVVGCGDGVLAGRPRLRARARDAVHEGHVPRHCAAASPSQQRSPPTPTPPPTPHPPPTPLALT